MTAIDMAFLSSLSTTVWCDHPLINLFFEEIASLQDILNGNSPCKYAYLFALIDMNAKNIIQWDENESFNNPSHEPGSNTRFNMFATEKNINSSRMIDAFQSFFEKLYRFVLQDWLQYADSVRDKELLYKLHAQVEKHGIVNNSESIRKLLESFPYSHDEPKKEPPNQDDLFTAAYMAFHTSVSKTVWCDHPLIKHFLNEITLPRYMLYQSSTMKYECVLELIDDNAHDLFLWKENASFDNPYHEPGSNTHFNLFATNPCTMIYALQSFFETMYRFVLQDWLLYADSMNDKNLLYKLHAQVEKHDIAKNSESIRKLLNNFPCSNQNLEETRPSNGAQNPRDDDFFKFDF